MRALCVTLAVLTGCAHAPSGSPAAPSLEDVAAAEQRRDLEALQAMHPEDPAVRAEWARALFWVGGLELAAPALREVCADARLAATSKERSGACARLAIFDALGGREAYRLVTLGAGPLLPKQKLLIAMVSIADRPAEPFIIDTGAPMTVLSKRYADRVGLPYRADLQEISADAGGNAVHLFPALLGSVTWGQVRVEAVPAFVIDLPENFKVGGILSPQDLLRGSDFELDGPGLALRTLDEAPSLAFSTPILWSGGNLYAAAAINGAERAPFLLDTGAGSDGACDSYPAKLEGGEQKASSAAAGKVGVRVGLEGTFAVGDEPPTKTGLFVTPCPDERQVKQGYIGAPWFFGHRTVFTADRRTLRYQR